MSAMAARPDSPGAIVHRFIACLNAFDLAGAQALTAGDFVWENMPMHPPANRVHGGAAMVRRLGAVFHVCDRIDWRILEQAEDGGTVLNERLDQHWFRPGIFPRSDYLGAPVMGVWKIRDGRIALWRDYSNPDDFENQLGMSIPDFGRYVGNNYGQEGAR